MPTLGLTFLGRSSGFLAFGSPGLHDSHASGSPALHDPGLWILLSLPLSVCAPWAGSLLDREERGTGGPPLPMLSRNRRPKPRPGAKISGARFLAVREPYVGLLRESA